jgi:hypothetical protein
MQGIMFTKPISVNLGKWANRKYIRMPLSSGKYTPMAIIVGVCPQEGFLERYHNKVAKNEHDFIWN